MQEEDSTVVVQKLIDLVNSNKLTRIQCGNSFPPGRNSIRGELKNIAVADDNLIVSADLSAKQSAKFLIPVRNLNIGVNNARTRVTVSDGYMFAGRVISFEP